MSDRQTKVAWRLFWAWEDVKEEEWLRDIARQGWHLRRAALLRCTFDRGEPIDMVYKLDYNILAKRDLAEYLSLFRSAGWEHVGDIASWHYFRTPATAGSDPDIFSDVESRVGKYRRLLGLLLVLFPIFMVSIGRLVGNVRSGGSITLERIYAAGAIAHAVLVVLWLVAFLRIWLHIRALRRRGAV